MLLSKKHQKQITYKQWLIDINSVPEQEQVAWIKESLKPKHMLHIFGHYFFDHIIKGVYETPESHKALIQEMTNPEDGAIIFPRGFAKSSWEKIDTIHDIVYGLEPVILYISRTITDAGFHFESIKSELEGNELLRIVYGNLVPSNALIGRKWTNRHFETINSVNVVARGRGKGRGVNIKNQRPTKVIMDDIEDDDSVKSPDQRVKLERWLYDVIFPSIDKERGFAKMIGTVISEHSELKKFFKRHGGIWYNAVMNGQSIWPEMYSLAGLEKIKNKIGSRAYQKEYMNNPKADSEATIKPVWIEQAFYSVLPDGDNWQAVIYIDPMAGESKQSDEFAITVLYVLPGTAHRYVVEQIAGRAGQLDQLKELVKAWIRHKRKVRAVGIEKVLNQTGMWQLARDWKTNKISFNNEETLPKDQIPEDDRNIPIIVRSPKGKDKLARLQVFEPDFERGEIHLRAEMETLVDQVTFLADKINNKDHDDRADSLVGALEMSYDFSLEQKVDELLDQRNKKEVYNPDRESSSTIMGNVMDEQF